MENKGDAMPASVIVKTANGHGSGNDVTSGDGGAC